MVGPSAWGHSPGPDAAPLGLGLASSCRRSGQYCPMTCIAPSTKRRLEYVCAEKWSNHVKPTLTGPSFLGSPLGQSSKFFSETLHKRGRKKWEIHQQISIHTLRRCVLRCHQRRRPGFGTFTACVVMQRKPRQRVGALMLKGVHLGIQKCQVQKKWKIYSIKKMDQNDMFKTSERTVDIVN